METKALEIDVAEVARDALRDRQGGEDLDEALLRSPLALNAERKRKNHSGQNFSANNPAF